MNPACNPGVFAVRRGVKRSIVQHDSRSCGRVVRQKLTPTCTGYCWNDFSNGEDSQLVSNCRGDEDERDARETQKLWMQNVEAISRIDTSFFSSVDARLSTKSETWKRGLVYKGLNATIDNCAALQRLYRVFYAPKKQYGIDYEDDLRRLLNTVSQFLRLCVARGVCGKHEVFRMEVLFRSATNLSLVQRFINFHIQRRSSRTVERKARHLRRVCIVASGLVGSKIERSNNRVLNYVDVVIKASKRKSEFGTAEPQSKPVLPLELIRRSFRATRSKLIDLMGRYDSNKDILSLSCGEQKELESDWTHAFVTFIVLCSSGQNPQSLSDAEVPCQKEFENMLGRAAKDGFVELPTLRKRRTTALDLPNITLPLFCIPFLRFQVYVIHKIIAFSLEMDASGKEPKPLFLDNGTGKVMNPLKITREFKKFVYKVSPEADPVNISSLRRCSLNTFLCGFRAKGILEGLTEDQFFDSMARHMNTTPVYVKKCIGVQGSLEYMTMTRQLTKYLN